jgi:hypothetical protein
MGLVLHKERCPENAKLRAFVEWWDVDGPFQIVILRGTTTDVLQLNEYRKGRSQLANGQWIVVDKNAVVTHAHRAADSAHGHAAAFDAHPVRALYASGGVRLVYLGDEADEEVRREALKRFRTYDDLARGHGLEAGDMFKNLVDRPHVQDPGWRSLPLALGVSS